FIVCVPSLIYSQISAPGIQIYGGGSAGFGDTKPFWNVSNHDCIYSLNPFSGIVGATFESIDSSDTFIHINYGLEFKSRLEQNGGINLQRGYIELKSPLLTFWAGRKYEIIGNQDSLLSLGSTVWSPNARPMPKLVIATPGYIDVPFTQGYVEVNGSLAHGWFEKGRYTEDLLLHQKYLHIRVGGDFFINASVGFIHFAQWGGSTLRPGYESLPSDWEAYKKVFFAQEGDSTNVGPSESINKLGNHLGSRTYRIDAKAKTFTLSMYYQTLFEDGSGMAHEFYRDGLAGISFKTKDPRKLVNHIVFESLHTMYQSGPVHILTDSIKLTGNDNYFNHGIYKNGWTYHKMTLGTPLITSPVYNEDGIERILNNRVWAFHLGIGGQLRQIQYRSFFTYSINKGLHSLPIDPPKNQFSWYFETTLPSIWRGIDLNIMLAADIGKMYGNNLGVNLLFRKTFNPFP
ncbi:MAG: hypothetical protein PF450_13895, partial [Bacteroidales bacterium]|nr:hypothetical protein [Bacteroidales bacterium]